VTTSTVSESTTVEPNTRTASIIPFPARPKPAELTPEERLARALSSLNTALAEQRIAVSAWRDVLAELKTTTTGLHDSLQNYRANLRTLGNSVTALQSKARSLEAWADSVTAIAD
jgi:ABC-type transporter Mla subunit MlaD